MGSWRVEPREPDKIVAARIGNAGGVVIGMGEDEMFVASDLPAILEHTRNVVFLKSRQIAVVTRQGVEVQTLEGVPVIRASTPGCLGPGLGRKRRVPPFYGTKKSTSRCAR